MIRGRDRVSGVSAQAYGRLRYKRAALAGFGAAIAKVTAALVGVVSVPLTIRYLGTERFGIWMTVSSLLPLLSFADGGMGNGLINAISAAHGNDADDRARRAVSTAFYALLLVAAMLVAAGVTVTPRIDWGHLFTLKSSASSGEIAPTILALLLCVAAALPLGVATRVQVGFQDGLSANLWQAVGNLIGLCGVIVVARLHLGLVALVLATTGAGTGGLLLSFLVEFGIKRRGLRPTVSAFSWTECRSLLKIGASFLTLQVIALVCFYGDNIIIAARLGVAEVSLYAITQKLFLVSLTLQLLLVNPLWPAYGEAQARGDHRWIRRTFYRSLVAVSGIWLLVAGPMVAAGKPLAAMLSRSAVIPSTGLLCGFAFWTLLNGYGGAIASCANGLGILKVQVVCGLVFTPLLILLKWHMVAAYGVGGLVWSNCLLYPPVVGIPIGLVLWRRMKVHECGVSRDPQRLAAVGSLGETDLRLSVEE